MPEAPSSSKLAEAVKNENGERFLMTILRWLQKVMRRYSFRFGSIVAIVKLAAIRRVEARVDT